jgi:hypothetical protein
MATVSRRLPERPHLDVPKREARELLNQWRNGEPDAFGRIRRRHPRFAKSDDSALAAGPFRLSDAQLVIAREYGFAHWAELKQRIAANSLTKALETAIRANDRDAAVRLIQMRPELLHLPIVSGDWGPPMSHAANLGRLEIVQTMAALGARDFQHALRSCLASGADRVRAMAAWAWRSSGAGSNHGSMRNAEFRRRPSSDRAECAAYGWARRSPLSAGAGAGNLREESSGEARDSRTLRAMRL